MDDEAADPRVDGGSGDAESISDLRGEITLTQLTQLPIFTPQYTAEPYPYWADLRENAPVFWDEEHKFWVVSRFEDVEAMALDTATFSSASGPSGGIKTEASEAAGFLPMIQDDPPEHTRLRALLSRSFTSRRIASLEAPMHKLASDLLANINAKLGRGESADFYTDYASPLPVWVIAELLGIPSEYFERLTVWNQSSGVTGLTVDAATRSGMHAEMSETLAMLIEQKRVEPSDDLISSLVSIADDGGERLRADELLGFCRLLWIAGNETTTNLICNAAVYLQEHPEVTDLLRADKSQIVRFVEEALRFQGPVNGLFRRVTQDTSYKGCQMKAGDNVWLLYASANRDESQFDNAGVFGMEREQQQHIAFGKGIHFCLGAPLARMEARIAFEHLVDVLPTYQIHTELGRRLPVPVLRGWLSLPMSAAQS